MTQKENSMIVRRNEDIDRLMLGANYKVIRWISSPRYAARAYDEMIIAK
jgi:hypothetical protein